jgi:hypothetical protein
MTTMGLSIRKGLFTAYTTISHQSQPIKPQKLLEGDTYKYQAQRNCARF